MSKERLEEIKEKLIRWKTEETESTYVDFRPKDIRDIEWLIQQAEEKQKLEERVKELEYKKDNYQGYLQQISDYMVDDINCETETSPYFIKNICEQALNQ